MIRRLETQQRPTLVGVERRPLWVRSRPAKLFVGVPVRVLAPEGPVLERRRDILEARQHPLPRRFVPEDRRRLAQRTQDRVRISNERRVVDVEGCDELVEVTHRIECMDTDVAVEESAIA